MAAERVHGEDTSVPVLAKGKTVTGRLWTYVRDDQPFGGPEPPAAMFYYSRDRRGEHPNKHLAGYAGILQADAYAGFRRCSGSTPSSTSSAASTACRLSSASPCGTLLHGPGPHPVRLTME